MSTKMKAVVTVGQTPFEEDGTLVTMPDGRSWCYKFAEMDDRFPIARIKVGDAAHIEFNDGRAGDAQCTRVERHDGSGHITIFLNGAELAR